MSDPRAHAADADWQADLDRFRASHRPQRRVLAGHSWEYIRSGAGAAAVLVLPGGLAVAETAFRYIQGLAPRYSVLAPTYPETIATMAQLVDGLLRLLRAERIARLALVGGSYSGLVAQCLLRRAPQLVERLVLADTGVPRPSRAYRHELYRLVLLLAPLPLIGWMFDTGVAASLRQLPQQRVFWRRYFRARIVQMRRAAYLSHLAIWQDFDWHYRFAPQDLAQWRGQLLIVDAEHDRMFPPAERRALRRLYPRARSHTFTQFTHGASLAHMDSYIEQIARFLDETGWPDGAQPPIAQLAALGEREYEPLG